MTELLSFGALGFAVVIAAVWAGVVLRAWRTISAIQRLPHENSHIGAARPKVSVVLAARNEGAIIERAVRSLLNQEELELSIVAVDDGSEDDTLATLERLAVEDPRLLVLASHKLPMGWVAKNYALELGQGRADGDYLLFTDADVIHSRRALRHAVSTMEMQSLDHLALHPRLEASTWMEAIVLPLHFLLTEFRFFDPKSVHPDSGVGAGIGAFNLVRAEAYRLRGTHARIRGAVRDDQALGRMMRDEGGRGSVMRAVTDVRMRPYRSVSAMYSGIRKGVLAAFGNSASLTFVMGLLLAVGATLPPLILLGSAPLLYSGHIPWGAFPALLALVLPAVGLMRVRSMVRFEPLAAILYPVGAMLLAVSAIHAALVFGLRGTIEWRGREYRRQDLEYRS